MAEITLGFIVTYNFDYLLKALESIYEKTTTLFEIHFRVARLGFL